MHKVRNIYRPLKATLETVIDESPLIKTLVLRPEKEFSFDTGQFIELTLDGYGEAPFTPSSSPFIKDKLEVTIMKAGHVTEKFHQLVPGAFLGIRGPYGRGYPVYNMYEKEVVIVVEGKGRE